MLPTGCGVGERRRRGEGVAPYKHAPSRAARRWTPHCAPSCNAEALEALASIVWGAPAMTDELRHLVRGTYNKSLRDDRDTRLAFGCAVRALRERRPLLNP